jgi:hypothetical protein
MRRSAILSCHWTSSDFGSLISGSSADIIFYRGLMVGQDFYVAWLLT